MSTDMEIWVEAVAFEDAEHAVAEGFDADGDDITFAAGPAEARAFEEAIAAERGPVLTTIPASSLLSLVRLAIDTDAMVVPRHLVPSGHWFG